MEILYGASVESLTFTEYQSDVSAIVNEVTAHNQQFISGQIATECHYLGDAPSPAEVDVDVFSFSGVEGEEINITLEANGNGFGRAGLIVNDAIEDTPHLFEIDRSTLPNEITATLPETGEYQIGIVEQHGSILLPGSIFRGAYCFTLNTTQGAAGTLQPTATVEGAATTLGTAVPRTSLGEGKRGREMRGRIQRIQRREASR
jgi:hypothetical protein